MTFKPRLTFWQIWNMNIGFLGIQFSFGLQQTAVNPIFSFLGATNDQLPLLNLAGPITGLLIQPLIGAISDKTWSPRWGRRKPFFLIGAIIGSLCLFAFPFSPELWFAVGLLWILDVGNNTAMEPYRAFIGDKLPEKQLTFGFQMQSLFVGAGIVLANLSIFLFQDWFGGSGSASETATSIPTWLYYSFFIGAIASITTILWSVLKTPETPPSAKELETIELSKKDPFWDRIFEPIKEIIDAISGMSKFMWRLAAVYLFQWYALFCYWQFIAPMLRESLNINEGVALGKAALMNGSYNFITMIVALALVPIAKKFSNKKAYVISLFLSAIAMISLPFIKNQILIFLPMLFLGIGWAAMMGIPYAMVSKIVPQGKRGVYMGIVNMMIVIPMFIQTITFGSIIKHLLNNRATNAIIFGGVFFAISAILAMRLNVSTDKSQTIN
ncbi:MFS transporter [Lutibacter sp.]|uniref:MFS transporter n=1 Tax=Lutibacter sp. TaxID=1925666 RepID=UPI0025C2C5B6|nr:MFS transporter [Lutibacter sp.]MCF6180881.1 MFS transporter [Lutibacter sp.]